MLNEPTLEKLTAMRLAGMARAWLEQQKDPDIAALGFDERFGLLVDAELTYRDDRRLKRLLDEAKLRLTNACVEDIDCTASRGLDKATVRQVATCAWIHDHRNLLVTGPTGTGKTYVGCAFAQQACRHGYKTLYRRLPRLFEELTLARADGTYARVLGRLARYDLLVLDDWGIGPLRDADRHDLLEVLEDRYGNRSTLVTSQLPVPRWHEYLGEPTMADAILDRLVHNAYKIALKGHSRRKTEKETTQAE
jgi:DNA replication protein DnaC